MRVLLAPHGTRGDVQPIVALALGLRERGHDVTFLAPDNFVEWIRSYGFACEADGVDVEAALRSPGGDLTSLRWQMPHFNSVLIPALFESFMRVDTDVDVIVGAGVQVAAPSIAGWRDIPFASVVFCPCAVPNSDAPPPSVRTQSLPRWVNRLLWDLTLPLGGLALRGAISEGRRRVGLAPIANLVTADVLTERIATALEERSIRDRTRAMAPAIAGRDGVAAAVDYLERLVLASPATTTAAGSGRGLE